MREILFRGKRIDNGYWVEGFYWTMIYQPHFIRNTECGDSTDHEINPETVGQFTGLTDKNGVNIFEHDIVYLGGYGDYTVQYPFIELFEACFEGDIGSIKGNIHDNPELL